MGWQSFKRSISFVMVTTLTFAPMALAEEKHKLTWQQRGEIWNKGTITDSKGQVWNVLYILGGGSESINQYAEKQFSDAFTYIKELGSGDFWTRQGKGVQNGLVGTEKAITSEWIGKIGDNYSQTREKSSKIDASELGGGFEIAFTWGAFVGAALLYTLKMPFDLLWEFGGKVVATPIIGITVRPVVALGQAVGLGVAGPGVFYVWNGFAWTVTTITTLTISRNEPTTGSFLISLDPDKKKGKDDSGQPGGSDETKKPMVIDKEGLFALLKGAIGRVRTNEQLGQMENKMRELLAERRNLGEQERQLEQKLNDEEAYRIYRDLINRAYNSSHVSLSPEAKDLVSMDGKLNEVIGALLKSYQLEATPERVVAVRKLVLENLEKMRAEMARIMTETPTGKKISNEAETPSAGDLQ